MLELSRHGAAVMEDGARFEIETPSAVAAVRGTVFSMQTSASEWAPDNRALPARPLSPGQYFWRVVSEAGGVRGGSCTWIKPLHHQYEQHGP